MPLADYPSLPTPDLAPDTKRDAMPQLPFPEYEDNLTYIRDSEVQEAYKYMVNAAQNLAGYTGKPKPHGFISRNFHYFALDGQSPFAFTVAQNWLLFYFRQPRKTHPALAAEDLRVDFSEVNALEDGQLTIKIRTKTDAQAIMRIAFSYEETTDELSFPDEVTTDLPLVEGAIKSVLVNNYERNPRARQACIDHYGYKCAVCGLIFENVYGALGRNFIHVHHLIELSTIGREYIIDPIRDLRPVCANCHAMLHRNFPALTVEVLKRNLTS
jgi:hypothetical protein